MARRAAGRRRVLLALYTALRAATRRGGPSPVERLGALPRLVRSTLRGEYAGTTRAHLAALAAALVYVMSPVDLVPEAFLSLFGLVDDMMLVGWVTVSLVNDTEAYLAWERGEPVRAPHGSRTPPAGTESAGPQDARSGATWPQDARSGATRGQYSHRETVVSHVVP